MSLNTKMAMVRSTARVSREGDMTEATETIPISEVMRQSGLVVSEEAIAEGASNAEAEQIVAEGESDNESEENNNILSPAKPSHIEFGKSTVTADDMVMMKKLGYFGEAESNLVRFAGEEVVPQPREDKVVVFKIFFRAGLRFPLHDMIGEVLKNFEIPRAAGEDFFTSRMARDLRVFPYGRNIAAVVSAVMSKDRQEVAQKRRAVIRLPEARPKRARGAAKATAPGGSQSTLAAKPAAPRSSKVPESVKAAGTGGTKAAPAGAAKTRELPSPGKRVADFGTNISVDDYLVGKFYFDW
jgi:hypothetical protein